MTHPCLKIPEALTLIFGSLQRKKDLLSAALACHAFLEPAMDNLWREICLFAPLLACLPTGLWEYEEEDIDFLPGQKRKVAYLLRELKVDDLERYMEFYSHRIRVVEMTPPPGAPSVDFLQALQAITDFQPGALSPRIVQCTWTTTIMKKDFWRVFPFLTLFLGPNIVKLTLMLHPDVHSQGAFLRYIFKHLPRLKDLDIDSFDNFGDPPHYHCDYLDSLAWDHLETVTLCGPSGDAIRRLSSLPRLRTLTLSGLQDLAAIVPKQTGQDGPMTVSSGFRSLRTIKLSSTLRSAARFLQRLPPENRVEDLEVAWSYGSDEDLVSSEDDVVQVQLFINAVQRHMNPVTFQQLDVVDESDEIYEEPLELPRVTADISPLFIFEKLKKVDISFSDGIWLTPEQVGAIPTAWPSIQFFRLHEDYNYSRIPRVNHTHLLELAYRCRGLRSLGFPFDASQINGEESHLAPAGFAAPRLQTLFVAHSPIESPSEVVSFLMFHFPELSILDCDESGDPEPHRKYTRRWQEVAAAMS